MSNVRAQVTADSSSFQQAMKAAVLSMKELSSEYSLASTQAKLFGNAQDALKAKADELKAKISAQTDIVKLNESQQKKLEDTLKTQKEKQATLAAQIGKTKEAIEESTKATGEDSEETNALKEKLDDLEAAEKTVSAQIEKTEQQLSKQETATNKSKEALAQMESELEKTNKALKEAKWNEFAKNATAAADVLEGVGTKLSVVSAAIVGIGTAAVKTTADFDAEMSTVQSISGATGNRFDALREKAVEMGSKTSFSASEAASAMEYMAMAGWTTEDMLDGIAGVMNAAAASGEDLASTSDILTDGLTAFGLSAADSAHFADVLVKAGNSANTSVSMMGETFKYAGAVCGTLGISVEDCAIATGLMGNAGIKASQAGTALRSGLTKLISPTDDAAAAMEQYGFSVQTNSDGSVDFMATMQNLRSAMSGLDATTQAAAISTIFGTEAMSGWSAIVNASEDDFNSLTEAIYNCDGAAQEAADIKLDNLSGQITILKSTIEGIAIQIGDILMPTVRSVVGVIQEWATRFSEADEKTKHMVVTIGAVVAAIGPAMLAVAKILKTIISVHDTIVKLEPVIKAVKVAISGVSAPVVAVAAVIAVLVAAFKTLWNTNEGFRTAITNIWKEIQATVGGFIQGVADRLSGLGITFSDVTSALWTIWSEFCNLLAPIFEGVFKQVSNILTAVSGVLLGLLDVFISIFKGDWSGAWEAVQGIFSTIWEYIKNTFQNALNTLKGVADVFLGWFGTSWDSVWNSISTFFKNIWNGISTFFSTVWNTITTAVSTAVNAVKTTITNVFTAVRDWITNALTTIQTAFSNIWNAVSATVSAVWNTIKNVIQVGIMFVVELVKAAFNLITLPWQFIWQNCHETIETVWNAIKTAVSTAIETVKNTLTTVLNVIKDVVDTVWTAISTTTSTVWNAIKTTMTTIWEAIKTAITAAINAVKTTITTVWNAVSTATTTVWNTIKTGISTAWTAIKTAVSTAINAVKSTVSTVWNAIKSATTTAWNAVKTAVTTPINAAKTAVNTAISAVKTAISSVWNTVKSTTTSTWNAIKTAISTPINNALTTVKNVISKIKSAFNFSWSLPKLKMPHLSISGKFSINPPSVPHFSISWYKTGGIMTDPTIFGVAGSTALAGGEAGPEAILPLESFYSRLTEILDTKLAQLGEAMGVAVYVTCFLDSDEIAARQVVRVEKHLTSSSRSIRRATT